MWEYLTIFYSEQRLLVALFGTFLTGLVLTLVVRETAARRSLLDEPNFRSSHSVPVPRLGGVSIVFATMLGIAMLAHDSSWRTIGVVIAAVIMALAGFVDDLRSITPVQKYAPQLLAAIMAAWSIRPRFHIEFPFAEFSVGGLAAVILAAFWITAFINAFNFMDGVDGIAGGVGLVTALGMIVLTTGHATFLLLPLAAALAGFLMWNINPASIFMGDGGSQFAGFLLAAGALWWPEYEVNLSTVAIAFAPFLFDTGFTLVWRVWNRMNVFQAHRSHLYQRLTSVGFGHRSVANLYVGATAFCLMIAALYGEVGATGQVALLVLLVIVAFVYVSFVTHQEVAHQTPVGAITRDCRQANSSTPKRSVLKEEGRTR